MDKIIQQDFENIASALGEKARVLEGKTVLITGGAGFLGTYFVGVLHLLNERVLKRPCRVIVLDNFITGAKSGPFHLLASPHIQKLKVDITKTLPGVVARLASGYDEALKKTKSIGKVDGAEGEAVEKLLAAEPADYIIHAAGLASPVYYRKFPLETIDVTISGTKTLLEMARAKGAKSFLLFSSSEIYGDPDPKHIPTPETYRGNVSSIGPRSCYDESKRLAETISMVHYEFFGVPVKIVRPFNVYGPGMKPDDYRVVPSFLGNAIAGRPLPVHDRGSQTRTFCYISDAIYGFFLVLFSEKGGEVYNVGNDKEEISMKDLATAVAGLFPEKGVEIKMINYPDAYPADEPKRRCPDLEKIRYYLGYETKVDLRTGLLRTLAWYQDNFPVETFEA